MLSAQGSRSLHAIQQVEFGDIDTTGKRWAPSRIFVVYQNGGTMYRGTYPPPLTQTPSLDTLEDVTEIPVEHYCPLLEPGLTRAPSQIQDSCYVKRPNLISYDHSDRLSQLVLEEAKVCERLMQYPHENIAEYYGCKVQQNRITGLCFRRYDDTLMNRANPGFHCKRNFVPDLQQLAGAATLLDGVRHGIDHLHSLGLVHNDLNPANIMLNATGHGVIIDFDSCRYRNVDISGVKRTPGWYDPDEKVSKFTNDTDALREMTVWLLGGGEYKFQDI